MSSYTAITTELLLMWKGLAVARPRRCRNYAGWPKLSVSISAGVSAGYTQDLLLAGALRQA
jgi:hypothetical protein